MVNDLGNTDDLELMPTGGGYMVRRDRLMNELIVKGRKAGIVLLYAPDGFGKTSVLLQYVQEVKSDPTRGPVRIIEADRAIGRELFMQLEVVADELKDKPHSLDRQRTQSRAARNRGSHQSNPQLTCYGDGGLYYLPPLQPIAYPRAGRFCKSQCADAQGARL